jgi:hypothetical protein
LRKLPSTEPGHGIKALLAERGARPLTLHSLRHTFGTRSLESGKSVKWVSHQLGHRDASLTLNVYAHALPDEETDLSISTGMVAAFYNTKKTPGAADWTIRPQIQFLFPK